MKFLGLVVLSFVSAIPSPSGDDDFCESTITQKLGAIIALQDPRKACNHNHGLAHLGLQRDAGANSKTPEGADILFLNTAIEGVTNLVGLGVDKPEKSHGDAKKHKKSNSGSYGTPKKSGTKSSRSKRASKKPRRKVTKTTTRKYNSNYKKPYGKKPMSQKASHPGH